MFTAYPNKRVFKGAEEKNANSLVSQFMSVLKSFKDSIKDTAYEHNFEIKQFLNRMRCHVVLENNKSGTFRQVFENEFSKLMDKFSEVAEMLSNLYNGILAELTRYDRVRKQMGKPKSQFSSF